MIITLTRTGGFTGIPLKKTIDTTALPKTQAQKLEELVSQSSEIADTKANTPDAFSYTLSVEESEKSMQVTLQESLLSSEQKSLLQELLKGK